MSDLKFLNGRPTKKFIQGLCEKHGLVINRLDTYGYTGVIAYSYRPKADEKAKLVVDELQSLGIDVNYSKADREVARCGIIRVQVKSAKASENKVPC